MKIFYSNPQATPTTAKKAATKPLNKSLNNHLNNPSQNASKKTLNTLENILGYTFKNPSLLAQSLVHRSFSRSHNERFEFLGDGLLNFIIAEYLYLNLPELEEGTLSNLRAHFVCEEMLHEIALELNLGEHLILGLGERKTGGAARASLLADALEAICAAIYQDAGFEGAKLVILSIFKDRLNSAQDVELREDQHNFKDAKSRLQEHLQSRKKPLPLYELLSIDGKDHEQYFKIACIVGKQQTTAIGTSRKRAEREAATLMLEKIL
ncbi:ribonuclease 3 [Gammaproteobacteria bacterium]|nr:ribonuclease 3 [Gammaproteobacteria bacterium]